MTENPPLLEYAYTHAQTEATTGYFSCEPQGLDEDQALRLKRALLDKGWPLMVDSPTNQQFVVVPDEIYAQLAQKYSTDYNGKPDPDHTAIRFCTGWSTSEEDLDTLIDDIRAL